MRYYPIFLNLRGRSCAVVGGGRVAERRVLALLRAGASVRVVSPAVTPRLALLATRKKIELTPRAFRKGDLAAAAPQSGAVAPLLVFAATDDPATQEVIRGEAEALGALVNIANDLERSAFLVPASFQQGDLQVAISTSGASPALARTLRRQLQGTLGREYKAYLRVLRATRRQVLKTVPTAEQRKKVLRQLASSLDWALLSGPRRARGGLQKLVSKLASKQ